MARLTNKAKKELYMKERRRIQTYISKRRSKGYEWEYQLPTIPDKVKVSDIRNLKKYTTEFIKNTSTKVGNVNLITGEILEDKPVTKTKLNKTVGNVLSYDKLIDLAYQNLVSEMEMFPGKYMETVLRKLQDNRKKYGDKVFYNMLLKRQPLAEFFAEVGYNPSSDEYREYSHRLTELLIDENNKADATQILDEDENWQ